MSEYGCGVSLVQAFNYDKERLLKALDGQLMCGETEDGFEYAPATEKECREFIIQAFDNAVYHAIQGYSSGKIMEQVAEANGIDIYSGQIFQDYLHFKLTGEQDTEEEYNYGDPADESDDLE